MSGSSTRGDTRPQLGSTESPYNSKIAVCRVGRTIGTKNSIAVRSHRRIAIGPNRASALRLRSPDSNFPIRLGPLSDRSTRGDVRRGRRPQLLRRSVATSGLRSGRRAARVRPSRLTRVVAMHGDYVLCEREGSAASIVLEVIAAAGSEFQFLRRDEARAGGLLRSSSGRLRTTLVEAAWTWVAHDKADLSCYRRLVANNGSDRKAIVGKARHLRSGSSSSAPRLWPRQSGHYHSQ
jgi:hypothetical protein